MFTCAPYLETKEIDAVIFRVVLKWNIYVASDPDPDICSVFVFSLLSSLIICSDWRSGIRRSDQLGPGQATAQRPAN